MSEPQPTMTFHEYISTCRVFANPVGDFVKDARNDPTLPNATTWPELKQYLESRGSCSNAIVAARDCFNNYRHIKRRR